MWNLRWEVEKIEDLTHINPLEDGPPDPSPTVSVWEFRSLWGFGEVVLVPSQGMWAKSLKKLPPTKNRRGLTKPSDWLIVPEDFFQDQATINSVALTYVYPNGI